MQRLPVSLAGHLAQVAGQWVLELSRAPSSVWSQLGKKRPPCRYYPQAAEERRGQKGKPRGIVNKGKFLSFFVRKDMRKREKPGDIREKVK